ncbi:endo alpha-1,4 polygalactosaminidase [Photobacterium sp. SDRW27]|uniref:endo alpha-1,4 polygalactosaminidase n=1 Tax=Photobacterium obscurum TaxID=2829490 RepID=UPI002242F682|nr:endo alpha-1,4 polygalactosaminidase [Photobacterium obscurum]MCW8329350.1 endo alpha-1,4 polygalactosaminidase [Photobacterium obscurum]
MRLILSALVLFTFSVSAQTPASIAFYYNSVDSVRELMNYDRVVVSPALISHKQIKTLHKADTQVFSYISVGEFEDQTLPAELRAASKAKNTNWGSYVMDLSSLAWQQYLEQKATTLLEKGFDGLFLDTLDSYYLFASNSQNQLRQQHALASIIDSFNQLDRKPKIILNRGFEVIELLNQSVYGVVAESLYHSYSPVNKSYHQVKNSDSEWLSNKLATIRSLGIETIVIDYIPADNREGQRAAAHRLLKEGYTPYISDGMLYEFGVSTIEPIPKRVLGFYDGLLAKQTDSECHRMFAMPLEYFGYVPECHDIQTTNYSNIDLSRYAAIFLWLEDNTYQHDITLQQWLTRVVGHRPLLFINSLPADETLRRKLGLSESGTFAGKISVSKEESWLGSQYSPSLNQFEPHRSWAIHDANIQTLLAAEDQKGNTSPLLIKAPWGGAALSPLPVINLANNKDVWVIDPFRLIEETLNLPVIPAADTTTESARRILTSHVDGDGFPSKAWFPGRPYTAEVLLDHVFKKYPLPQTVSVIEGEIGKRGLYPKQSQEMEKIARKIFALPNIEVASHTFSHPFFWDQTPNIMKKQYGDHLPIPGYSVDYHNEIIGSTDYINKNLAPKGKRVKLILWSGNATPSEDVLAIAEKASLLNVNGGNTYVVNGDNSYAQVSPTIAWYPSAVHVYAPVLNENLYTNLWTEHHDGYGRAIETFNLLGNPRRLKTISIYYHMYSGAYPASLKGLIDVYDWAIKQKTTPLYLSEYAQRASSLYETGLAKTLDGGWQITSSGISSIRLPHQLGYPNTVLSNIAGWDYGLDGKYLILKSPRSTVVLNTKPDNRVRLKSANGKLIRWNKIDNTIKWAFQSHVPLEFEVANGSGCQIESDLGFAAKQINHEGIRFKSNIAGVLSGTLYCK